MPVSSALQRLMHLRGMEEEQARRSLDSALAELRRLRSGLDAAHARQRLGRILLGSSVGSGPADRTAVLVELRAASRLAAALARVIAAADTAASAARQEYLNKRLERRQVQTLIEQAEQQRAIEAGRRSQQSLDETFGARRHRVQLRRIAQDRAGSAPRKDDRSLGGELELKTSAEPSPFPHSGTKSKR